MVFTPTPLNRNPFPNYDKAHNFSYIGHNFSYKGHIFSYNGHDFYRCPVNVSNSRNIKLFESCKSPARIIPLKGDKSIRPGNALNWWTKGLSAHILKRKFTGH